MVKLILVIQKNLLSLADYFYSLYSINEAKQTATKCSIKSQKTKH